MCAASRGRRRGTSPSRSWARARRSRRPGREPEGAQPVFGAAWKQKEKAPAKGRERSKSRRAFARSNRFLVATHHVQIAYSIIENPRAKTETARALAVERLLRIEEEGAYVGLEDAGEAADAREARQATEYVAGVTRHRRWLDFVLSQFYRGDFSGMEPRLKQILRVGLYDFLFLHTPPHAALNEAVELAKRQVRPGAGRLTNGILRSIQRQKDDLPKPDTGDVAEDLALRHSHPTWMVRRWLDRFGAEETVALLEWNNRRPVYGLRLNPQRTTPDAFRKTLAEAGAEWEPPLYLGDFVRTQSVQPVLRAGLLQNGTCAVQDEAAGLVVRLLDSQPGEMIIDGCAAPGGKACYAAAQMGGQGRVLAFDVHRARLRLVHHAARQQGFSETIQTEAADLRSVARRPEPPQADRVLLDAPCSGLGVLAKRADLRWQRTRDDLDDLATLQDELLRAAARLVRPGGLLVYATCTTEPEENEARVAAFLEQHDGFALESASGFVPDALVTPEGFYATLPHRHGVDGAFGARLRRRA